jgi:hypothetical protein
MGHVLHAVIGRKPPVVHFAGRWFSACLVGLPQGFALVPLTESLFDEIATTAQSESSDPFPEFERLSATVEAALRDASAAGPVAYIETNYFGGCGTQSAIAWDRRKVSSGPFKTEDSWNGSEFVTNPPGERAINRVLAALGVVPAVGKDAFDTVNLSEFRSTESMEDELD